MKLYIKQHIFTIGDKFSVYDMHGNERYFVTGEVFTWGKKLHVTTFDGKEVAFIRQKVFTFLPRYYITVNGIEIAEVVKEFTFFRQEYSINGLGWRAEGDFLAHEYSVYNGEQIIASVSKQWFTLGDAYELNVSESIDEVTVLAVLLVIDACISAARNNN